MALFPFPHGLSLFGGRKPGALLATALLLVSNLAAFAQTPTPDQDLGSRLRGDVPLGSVTPPTLFGPGVLEFSKEGSTRGGGTKLTVAVYTRPGLTAEQKRQLAQLGIDPAAAAGRGAKLEAAPEVLKRLQGLDYIVHVVDWKLRKLSRPLATLAVTSETRGGGERVKVEVQLRGRLDRPQLQSLARFGLDPQNVAFGQVTGDVDAGKLAELAGLDFVVRVARPKMVKTQGVRGATDQGLALTTANQLLGIDTLHRRGVNGQGVRVAIIDGGFDPGVSGLESGGGIVHTEAVCGGTGNRRDVRVGGEGTVHGTAVAQIVRSVAPQAQLMLFALGGSNTPMGCLYTALGRVAALKPDVVSISMGSSLPEDIFLRGSGRTAMLIKRYITDQGIALIVAAGNEGESLLYIQKVQTDNRGLVQLGAAGRVPFGFAWPEKARNQVPRMRVFIAWDDAYLPEQKRRTDLELLILNQDGQVIARSDENQAADFPPVEGVELDARDPGVSEVMFAVVRDRLGTMQGPLRLGVQPAVPGWLERTTPDTSISASTFAMSPDSIVVGAVTMRAARDFDVDKYSSRGPQQDGVVRPDVVAPSNFAGTVYDDQAAVFTGTSSATPYVAGVVALMKSQNPRLTPRQIKQILMSTAYSNNGRDNAHGAGLVSPADAVSTVASVDRFGRRRK